MNHLLSHWTTVITFYTNIGKTSNTETIFQMDLENSLLANSFCFLLFLTDKVELQCSANDLTDLEFYLGEKIKQQAVGGKTVTGIAKCCIFQNLGLWCGDRTCLWHDCDVKQFFRKHRIYISVSFTDATTIPMVAKRLCSESCRNVVLKLTF